MKRRSVCCGASFDTKNSPEEFAQNKMDLSASGKHQMVWNWSGETAGVKDDLIRDNSSET
jgi:hypothetical protein